MSIIKAIDLIEAERGAGVSPKWWVEDPGYGYLRVVSDMAQVISKHFNGRQASLAYDEDLRMLVLYTDTTLCCGIQRVEHATGRRMALYIQTEKKIVQYGDVLFCPDDLATSLVSCWAEGRFNFLKEQ